MRARADAQARLVSSMALDSFPGELLTPSSAKKAREQEQAKRDANDRNISEYFTKAAGKPQPKPKVSHIAVRMQLVVRMLMSPLRLSRRKTRKIS